MAYFACACPFLATGPPRGLGLTALTAKINGIFFNVKGIRHILLPGLIIRNYRELQIIKCFINFIRLHMAF